MTERAEVVVVGAGPGGLSAALAAAQAGAQVTLIDGCPRPGGQYFRQMAEFLTDRSSARQRRGRALSASAVESGARVLLDTLVWGATEDNTLALRGPQAPPLLQAQAVILATGAYDRPVAFPGWTLPGVMTAGAARTLMTQGVLPGKRILLVGTGPLQLVLGAELARAGAQVVAVLEGSRYVRAGMQHLAALWGQRERLSEGLSSRLALLVRRVPYHSGWGVVAATGTQQVEQAIIARLDDRWRPVPGTERNVSCDTVCLGYGFIPFSALSRLLGARQTWHDELGGEVPERDATMQTSVSGIYAVGDGAGIGGAQLAVVEGQIAGLAAAAQLGHRASSAQSAIAQLGPALSRERRFQRMYGALFTPGPGLYQLSTDETVLCRCEEVTQGDLRRALALGADSANEVKSITRCGMGHCQGRMCGHLLVHLVARETGRSVADVEFLTGRPPLFPIPLGALGQTGTNSGQMESAEVARQ